MALPRPSWSTVLREKGLRATNVRQELLVLLEKLDTPVSAHELQALCTARSVDAVTVYRALEAFADAQLVRRVDLHHGHTDYELIVQGEHHHHLVCTNCGVIEDISLCSNKQLEQQALAASQQFTTLTEHSLEFFGRCNVCASP